MFFIWNYYRRYHGNIPTPEYEEDDVISYLHLHLFFRFCQNFFILVFNRYFHLNRVFRLILIFQLQFL